MLLSAITPIWAGFLLFGCGNPVVVLDMAAPSGVTAGSPLAITVTAIANGSRDKIFNSPVHFISTDAAAILPSDYAFTATDAGSHTFTGITLMTPGSQTIKVSDMNASSINGSVNVTVSAVDTAILR